MVGYISQRRDLSPIVIPGVPSSRGYRKYFYQPKVGPGSEKTIASLISHQSTRSYRSGGAYGSRIEDFHQILANNVEQFNWPFDTGHEFSTLKVSKMINSHEDYVVNGVWGNCYYRGPLFAVDPVPFWTGFNAVNGPRYQFSVPAVDITIGTKFLSNSRPGKAQANLSQLILETLRDMPRIPFQSFDQRLFDRRNLPKNIGSEYLNTVFGWGPLVSDVLKVCEGIVKIDKTIAQYQRDAGPDKTVRRSRELDPVRTTTSTVINTNSLLGFPYGPSGVYDGIDLFYDHAGNIPTKPNGQKGSRGVLTVETDTYEKYWFDSRWMYFLGSDSPVLGKLRLYAQLARKTLGIRLDLELLWELAPWTWFADWFANIGDVLAVNAAIAQDSQVLQYAYLMHETQVSQKYTHSGVLFGNGISTGAISSLITQRKKERVRATPYGFGVNLNALSATQIAILASIVASGYKSSKL